jgi:hypothetical protein
MTDPDQFIAAHRLTGRYHSPDPLAETEPPAASTRTMTPAEAVADIRDLRKGLTLGGLRIKDLISEGRKH